MAFNLSDSTPAAPASAYNVKWQKDAAENISAYIDMANLPAGFAIVIDGGGSAIGTGHKGYIQIPYGATIVGWSIVADQSGSISIEVDKKASSAPPSAPAIPVVTTDKISASAPPALSSAQSGSGGTSEVSTWTTTVAKWDVFGFNVSSAATLTRVTVTIFLKRS